MCGCASSRLTCWRHLVSGSAPTKWQHQSTPMSGCSCKLRVACLRTNEDTGYGRQAAPLRLWPLLRGAPEIAHRGLVSPREQRVRCGALVEDAAGVQVPDLQAPPPTTAQAQCQPHNGQHRAMSVYAPGHSAWRTALCLALHDAASRPERQLPCSKACCGGWRHCAQWSWACR